MPDRPVLSASLCSRNEHKLAELRAALPNWELQLLERGELPPEGAESYYANARAKACFGRATGGLDVFMIGEDSGIEADALGGGPGVESARFAVGDPVGRLLAELAGRADRGARYVCELVCLSPELEEFRGTGVLEGEIAEEARGSEGFGYDPIFVPDGETLTVAELGNDWKRAHSHRARAAQALRDAVVAGVAS